MEKAKELKKKLLEELKQQNLPQNLLKNINTSLQELLEQVEMETRLEKNNQCEQNAIKKITIWTKLTNGGDGSAYNDWYLTYEKAKEAEESDFEYFGGTGWGEECIGSVETYEGSDIHKKALENDAEGPWYLDTKDSKQNRKSFFQRQG